MIVLGGLSHPAFAKPKTSTDKVQYLQVRLETVIITSVDFAPNTAVTFTVIDPNNIQTSWSVTSGRDGSVSTTFQLNSDSVLGSYTLTASDGASTSSTTFSVVSIGVPEFGSLYVAIALGAAVFFLLSRYRSGKKPITVPETATLS
jgi:hypothetical protein